MPVNDPSGATGSQRFSPDGARFLRLGGALGGMTLYDTATWTGVAQFDLPRCQRVTPIPGGAGSAIPVLVSDRCGDRRAPSYAVGEIAPDGQFRIFEAPGPLPALEGQEIFHVMAAMDPSGRHILMTYVLEDGNSNFVFDRAGRALADIGPEISRESAVQFTRDGSALVVHDWNWLAMARRGFSFDGSTFEPAITDLLPFSHQLHGPGGRILIGYGSGLVPPGYAGQDLPEGPALYDMIWSALPAEIQDRISADRVVVD